MKKYAVVVAAGSGTRMGGAVPKQFMLLNGKPLLLHTVQVFLKAYSDVQVIVVLPENYKSEGGEILLRATDPSRIEVVTGGATRFHSDRKSVV